MQVSPAPLELVIRHTPRDMRARTHRRELLIGPGPQFENGGACRQQRASRYKVTLPEAKTVRALATLRSSPV